MKLVSCEVRGSYVSVFEPKKNTQFPDQEAKYGMRILIPKTDEGKQFMKKLKSAYVAVCSDKWPNGEPDDVRPFTGTKREKPLIYDGDTYSNKKGEIPSENKGHWFLNASNKSQPNIIHADNRSVPLTERNAFQSGDYCHVQLALYAYANASNGVGVSLDNVLVTRRGEPLTGKDDAESAFAEVKSSDGVAVEGFDDDDSDDLFG